MEYNFNQVIDRHQTGSVKWDFNQQTFGREDVLPMWVADMDFQSPQPVIDALVERAKHGIYGYSDGMDAYTKALIDWLRQQHGWEVEREWITFSPGVVSALYWLVRALVQPGEKVLIQSPVYPPFFRAIENHGCEIVNSPLKLENERFLMDFEDLEVKLASGVKLMILCNPHNPVGRVWTREELERLGKMCLDNDVIVISDEIHGDLIYEGYQHIPFASLSTELAAQSIVCTAPSKTFNLAGLQTSNIIISNPKYRNAFKKVLELNGIHHPNVFGITAMEAAYTHGQDWLEQLMKYLKGNVDYLLSFLKQELPQIQAVRPEGTYLAWLDFRALGMEPKALQAFLVQKAGVGLNAGYTFGPGGEGFERMNLACPRSVLEEGLQRIKEAVQKQI